MWSNLVDKLLEENEETKKNTLICIERDKVVVTLYSQLIERAKTIACNLQGAGVKKGDKIAILLQFGADFFPIFWGAVLCGAVVTPATISAKTEQLLELLKPDWIIGEPGDKALPEIGNHRFFSKEILRETESTYQSVELSKEDKVLNLFTSGSTGVSKIISLTQENLIDNLMAQMVFHHIDSRDSMMNWLPLEHSEAMVQFHLLPTILKLTQVQIDTDVIRKEPMRWLEYLTRYQVTVSWAPNFAYDMLGNKRIEEIPDNLKLDKVRYLINTGESVKRSSCSCFEDKYKAFGLKKDTLRPGWGMTETGGAIIFSKEWHHAPQKGDITASGVPIPGVTMQMDRMSGSSRGELLISGTVVSAKETENGVLSTGDYVEFVDQNLMVVGRKKDILIVNGENYSCEEMEDTIKRGCKNMVKSILCTAIQDQREKEGICIFAVKKKGAEKQQVMELIQGQMKDHWGFGFDLLIFVQENEIARTAIGKKKRGEMGIKAAQGKFPYYYSSKRMKEKESTAQEKKGVQNKTEIILSIWKDVLNIENLEPTDDFFLSGGSSIMIPTLLDRMEKKLKRTIRTVDLFDHPTVCDLLEALDEEKEHRDEKSYAMVEI